MDNSVILIDDSQNSVVIVDDDVEDGELEDDVVFVCPEELTRKEVEPPTDKIEEKHSNTSIQVGNSGYIRYYGNASNSNLGQHRGRWG